ncbi:MAG: hypothetical protein MPK62_00035 [Alphaproteobacteria bacterium]|nr:hypothetical protein [Alphaproteobacteria bacterium]
MYHLRGSRLPSRSSYIYVATSPEPSRNDRNAGYIPDEARIALRNYGIHYTGFGRPFLLMNRDNDTSLHQFTITE